jgi:prophage maintenance system killer protein
MAEGKDKNNKEVVVWHDDTRGFEIKAKYFNQSFWMTQAEVTNVFGTQRPAVTKHLRNIFKSGELSEKSVCSILEHTASDGKTYKTQYYNLDAIIAVGYRVNSKLATKFRIWATDRLREYVLRGYVLNEKRLQETKLKELETAHKIIQQALENRRSEGYERELLKIISDYANAWFVLNLYDEGNLVIGDVSEKKSSALDYDDVLKNIERFRSRLMAKNQATEIFGQEVGHKLQSVLGSVEQTFDRKPVYPSIEEKAAHLLYLTIKDHPFVDGNKRIGSLLFLFYLIENHCFYNRRGERKINDTALVALALLVAESKPEQKDVMIKLVVNLINKR